MNKKTRSIQVLLAVLLICIHYTTVAQTLNPPVLQFGEACDPTGITDFPIDLTFTTLVFNDDNEFIIELSDADGNFANPATNLKTLTSTAANNYNQMFNILGLITIQLPVGTFGKNYKIRVRTTSPVRSSVSSSFEAYHDTFAESELEINGLNNFALCDGGSKEVSLSTNVVGEYLWYRRVGATDTLVATTQEPKYTVTQGGVYFVVIDYGACGLPKSKFITATEVVAKIDESATVIEICGDEAYKFTATTNFSKYTYEWSLDGVVKKSSNSNTSSTFNEYTTPSAGQFGKYTLKIITDDCTSTSTEVELKPKTVASFTINTVGAGESILLPCESKKLEITGMPSSATIQWYKNDIAINGQIQSSMTATEPGEYYAIVTEASSSSCPATVKSEIYMFYSLKSFKPEIRIEDADYEDCKFNTVKLTIVGIKGLVNENANEYDITAEQIAAVAPELIQYKWYKDDLVVSGAITNEIDVNSYLENGIYDLEISTCGVGAIKGNTKDYANSIAVKLIAELPTITSTSSSNSLCPGGTITYTIDPLLTDYTYEWFKDGDTTPVATNLQDFDVDEIGDYVLKMSGLGCEKIFDAIKVVLFDESVVTVTPSEKVVINQGQTVTVTAAGADSYIWYQGSDTTGTILSTNETLDVNLLGFYTVSASVGNCTVEKTIEVVEQDDQIIVPNIVTPNEDGINDTWKLSNKYAFQPAVIIQLYNANGKEILKTSDYKNDWPAESLGNQKIFYYKIIKDDVLIKAGTISVLD